MKKLFLTICFIAAAFSAHADVIEVNNAEELKQREIGRPVAPVKDNRIPDGSDQEEIANFIKERLLSKKVIIDSFNEDDPNHLSSMNVQHSADYIDRMAQENKSTFEQIYDKALARISAQDETEKADTIHNRQTMEAQNRRQKQDWRRPAPDFPVVNITLPPRGTKVLAPAKEHIPFMFSDIEILPTGQISIEETIVVLANGQKLKHGLTRSLPRYSVSRDGTRHPIQVNLDSVTINDSPLPYKLETRANRTFIIPDKNYLLSPGVYTYKFKYIVNRHIWEYDDFNEFYWDVTGSNWNLVVARAGAIVTLPGQSKALGQTALTGTRGNLQSQAAIFSGDNNSFGFAATSPLFIGEGLHLLISLPKTDFVPVDWSQRFSWFLDDYGEIIVSIIGLIAILGAYYISWRQLQTTHNRSSGLKRSAPMLRLLAFNTFDKRSFVSFLLEAFKKQLIDFSAQSDGITFIKKSDNTSSLSRNEKKALQAIFGQGSKTTLNSAEKLPLERAFNFIRRDTLHKFRLFILRTNLGYILFSVGMLLLSELFIALMSYNVIHDFSLLLIGSAVLGLCIWLFGRSFKPRWLSLITKTVCTVTAVIMILYLSLYFRLLTCILIFVMIYGIINYTGLFARRTGLIKNNIKEAVDFASYLKNNAEHISLGREFLNQQANIFALEAQESYLASANIKDFYRLDAAKQIMEIL